MINNDVFQAAYNEIVNNIGMIKRIIEKEKELSEISDICNEILNRYINTVGDYL